MKKVMVVAYSYPAMAGSGVQRSVKFEKTKGLRRWFFDGLAWRMTSMAIPHCLIVLLKRRD